MLFEIMKHLRNFFTGEFKSGTYEITNGTFSLPFPCKYVLIEGSVFNDGVYEAPVSGLVDETFNGCVTAINPPKEFLDLVKDIEEYSTKNVVTPFVSESFGGYSYTKATDSKGNTVSWRDVFADRLNVWRKI